MKMGAQKEDAAIELACFRVPVTIHADWICGKVREKISRAGEVRGGRVCVSGLPFRIPIRDYGRRTVPKRIVLRCNQAMRRELRQDHRKKSLYRLPEDASVPTRRGQRPRYLFLRSEEPHKRSGNWRRLPGVEVAGQTRYNRDGYRPAVTLISYLRASIQAWFSRRRNSLLRPIPILLRGRCRRRSR